MFQSATSLCLLYIHFVCVWFYFRQDSSFYDYLDFMISILIIMELSNHFMYILFK
jgi:hypothetical protein